MVTNCIFFKKIFNVKVITYSKHVTDIGMRSMLKTIHGTKYYPTLRLLHLSIIEW